MSLKNIIVASQRAAAPKNQSSYYSYLNKYCNGFIYNCQAGSNFGLGRSSKFNDLVHKFSTESLNNVEEDINLNYKTNWRFLKWIAMMYGFGYCLAFYYEELMYQTDYKAQENTSASGKVKMRKQIQAHYSDIYAYRDDDPHAVYVSFAAQVKTDKKQLLKFAEKARRDYPDSFPVVEAEEDDDEDDEEEEGEGDEEEETTSAPKEFQWIDAEDDFDE